MSSSNPVICTFTCSEAAKARVLQAFEGIANDSRLNQIKLLATNDVKGIFEGAHSLTEMYELPTGQNIANSSSNAVESILGNQDCSALEVLDKCHELLSMMAKTEWLRDSSIVIEGDNSIFIEGSYNFMDFTKNCVESPHF